MSDASKETPAGPPEGPAEPIAEAPIPPLEGGTGTPVGPEPAPAPASLDPAHALATANDLLAKAKLLVEAVHGGATESEETKAAREAEAIKARIPNVKNLATHRRYIPDTEGVKVVDHDDPVTPNTVQATAQIKARDQVQARKDRAAELQARGERLRRGSPERLKLVKQEAIRRLFVQEASGTRYSPTSVNSESGDRYVVPRLNSDTGEYEEVDAGTAMLGLEPIVTSLNPEGRKEVKAVDHIKHAQHKAEEYRRRRHEVETPLYHRLMPRQVGLTDDSGGLTDELTKANRYERSGRLVYVPQLDENRNVISTPPSRTDLLTYDELALRTRLEMLINSRGLKGKQKRMQQKRLNKLDKLQAKEDMWEEIGVEHEGHYRKWYNPVRWVKGIVPSHGHGHDDGGHGPAAGSSHTPTSPTAPHAPTHTS